MIDDSDRFDSCSWNIDDEDKDEDEDENDSSTI